MKKMICNLFGMVLIFVAVVMPLQGMQKEADSAYSSLDEAYKKNLAARVARIQYIAASGGKIVGVRKYGEPLEAKKETEVLVPADQPVAKL